MVITLEHVEHIFFQLIFYNMAVRELRQKLNHLRHRLGGLRYHVVQESTQGNALSPVEFVRLVDNIIDEA